MIIETTNNDIRAARPGTFSIQSRLAELRSPEPTSVPAQSRMITVRLPRDQHERLKELAHTNKVSLNALCRAALEGAEVELFNAGDAP